jgi:hypothetical protein
VSHVFVLQFPFFTDVTNAAPNWCMALPHELENCWQYFAGLLRDIVLWNARHFHYQLLTLPFSRWRICNCLWRKATLPVFTLTFLSLCDQPGDCMQTVVCSRTAHCLLKRSVQKIFSEQVRPAANQQVRNESVLSEFLKTYWYLGRLLIL